jgi:VCBS repeat-containing protein
LYGKLTIGIDGHYTYTLNSDVSLSPSSPKTFTYTLNDLNGHTDTATLTINMNPQVVSTVDADHLMARLRRYADLSPAQCQRRYRR